MKVTDAGFDEYSLFHSWHTEDKGLRFARPTTFENGKLLKELKGKYGPDHWVDFINDFIRRKRTAINRFLFTTRWPCRIGRLCPHRTVLIERRHTARRGGHQIFSDMVEYMDKCAAAW